ncbi:MAG TPA: FtsX-like permease family protein [Urbifossiella sp.]|nr:FtsX-like permease family protein [Urbifossiella sp.]
MTPPRLSALARLRFAAWFCGFDLTERVARPVTVAVVLAVALTTAAATVALAVPAVAAEVRLTRLRQSPLARGVWVYSPTELGDRFTPDRLTRLEAAVRDKAPGAAFTVSGFHDVDLEFVDPTRLKLLQRRGRTVGPADEVLPAVSAAADRPAAVPSLVRPGGGFVGPDGPGVVLSPTLAKRLGLDPDAPPPLGPVRIQSRQTGRELNWMVVGVTRDPLPLGHDFLLTEAEDARLRSADPDRRRKAVRSGPLPAGWPEFWGQFPDDAQSAALKWRVEVKVAEDDARPPGRWLELTADDDRRESDWHGYLKRIAELVPRTDPKAAEKFAVVEADPTAPAPPPEPRGAYPKATVYVGELQHLRPAADAARGLDLYANDAARTLVDEIEATAARAQAVAVGLVAAFSAAGAVTLLLALYLRGRQKAPQVGMLRAMGATDQVLRAVVAGEAAALWLVGTVVGLALAAAAGEAGRRYYALTDEEMAAARATGWWVWAVAVSVATLVGCVVGNLAATRGVRRGPPAAALGLSS